ncbi:MAG: succinyl-CoA--3-ketoacid-CoA transferase, partial [Deltaproteobacteria bacterium]|nr:succinyl-CoA--3-ketoacid-CoA transferase [Deltaproteobacteria bacterium]
VTIVEAEQIVPVGSIEPDQVHVASIYVKRIVLAKDLQKWIERRTVTKRA